jgi:predicted acylesterase/phospholipase RssA
MQGHEEMIAGTLCRMLDKIHKEHMDLKNIHCLVFGGGGVRGSAHCGALIELERQFLNAGTTMAQQITRVSGASVGALMALFIALRVSPLATIDEFSTEKYKKFTRSWNVADFVNKWAIGSTDIILGRIKQYLLRFGGSEDLTFRQLYHRCGCNLSVSVTCLGGNYPCPEYHGYDNTPDFIVWKSVLASTAIPVLMPPVEIDGKLYVDGGLLDNLPVKPCIDVIQQTLVFRLQGVSSDCKESLSSYLMTVIFAGTSYLEHSALETIPKPFRFTNILTINTGTINMADFGLSEQDNKDLCESGRLCMSEYLQPKSMITRFLRALLSHFIFLLCGLQQQSLRSPTLPTEQKSTTAPNECLSVISSCSLPQSLAVAQNPLDPI